jgi:hypothetical protein
MQKMGAWEELTVVINSISPLNDDEPLLCPWVPNLCGYKQQSPRTDPEPAEPGTAYGR